MTATADIPSGQPSADPEVSRVVGALDALAGGDVALTIRRLEGLLARLRTAAAARELLVNTDRSLLKAALMARHQRGANSALR